MVLVDYIGIFFTFPNILTNDCATCHNEKKTNFLKLLKKNGNEISFAKENYKRKNN
jgi:predicted CXXCH cytochrome family protein